MESLIFLAWTWKRHKGYTHLHRRKHVSAVNIALEMTKRASGKTQKTGELGEHDRDLRVEMMLTGLEPGPLRKGESGSITFRNFPFAWSPAPNSKEEKIWLILCWVPSQQCHDKVILWTTWEAMQIKSERMLWKGCDKYIPAHESTLERKRWIVRPFGTNIKKIKAYLSRSCVNKKQQKWNALPNAKWDVGIKRVTGSLNRKLVGKRCFGKKCQQ